MNKTKFTKRGRNKAINVLLILSLAACFLIPFNVKADDTSLTIKHFAINCYMASFDATPQVYAGLYDMTETGWSNLAKDYSAQVKAIKPSFKALLYANLRTADDTYPGRQELYHTNGWLLKDQYGNLIKDDVGYLTDIGNSAYQTHIANYLKTEIDRLGYDGVFGDWAGPYSGAGELFWGSSATPINPRTNKPWTSEEALQALVNLHNAIKAALGSKLLCTNGIWSGYRFYDHQAACEWTLSHSKLDGFMSEGLWHPYLGSTPCIWMSEAQWLEAVQFTIWVQDNFLAGHTNRFFVPVVKLSYGSMVHTELPSGATQEQMARYAYASTLLGAKTGTASQIYFCTVENSAFSLQLKPFYDAPIGTPTNDYYMVSGTHVYARDFSNGMALVNPTSTNYAITLPSNTYWTYDGAPVTTLTVQAHTGTILLKQEATSTATIKAYCNTEGAYISRPITMDGSPTGYSTPHTFSGLTGTHTFTVPSTDAMGHPFYMWGSGSTSTTITVSSAGTYTAYYQGGAPPTVEIWTNKATYAHGETLKAYIKGFNPGPAVDVIVNCWFGLPGGGTYMLETFYTGTIPASYTSPVYTWKSVTIPYSAAVGTYSVNAELRNHTTNALIDSDTYYFTVT